MTRIKAKEVAKYSGWTSHQKWVIRALFNPHNRLYKGPENPLFGVPLCCISNPEINLTQNRVLAILDGFQKQNICRWKIVVFRDTPHQERVVDFTAISFAGLKFKLRLLVRGKFEDKKQQPYIPSTNQAVVHE